MGVCWGLARERRDNAVFDKTYQSKCGDRCHGLSCRSRAVFKHDDERGNYKREAGTMIYVIKRADGVVEVREDSRQSLPVGALEVTREQRDKLLAGWLAFDGVGLVNSTPRQI